MPKELTLTLPDATYAYLSSRGVSDESLGDYILAKIEPPGAEVKKRTPEELASGIRLEAADRLREAEAREWCAYFAEDIDTEWDYEDQADQAR